MMNLKSIAVVAGTILAALIAGPALAQPVGQLGSGQVWGNAGAARGVASPASMSAMFDRSFGSVQGSIVVRGASAWAVSPYIDISCGVACAVGRTNNFNAYPLNNKNGVQLGTGTGAGNGEGGSVSFFTRNPGGAAPAINQELGFVQAYAEIGGAIPIVPPPALVFITTEAWAVGANGAGNLFQATTRGETAARGEVCIAEGLKAMAAGASSCQVGMGIGTLNSANGTYDNGKRVLSASNPTMTVNQNSGTQISVVNSTNAASSFAALAAISDVASLQIGASATTNGNALLAGRSWVFAGGGPLVIGASGANPVIFAPNSTEQARLLLGFMVGTTTDPGAGSIAANTSILSPLHVGGSGTTGTQLTIKSTSGNGTTDAIAVVGGNNGATRIFTALGSGRTGFGSAAGAATPTNAVVAISSNVTAVDAALSGFNPLLHLVGADGGAFPTLVMDAFGATGLPTIAFRAAGGTAATKTGTPNGAFIGAFLGHGWDSTNGYSAGPQLSFKTCVLWTNTDHCSNFSFFVVKSGTIAQLESLRLQQSGGATFGNSIISTDPGDGAVLAAASIKSSGATSGIGYATGSGIAGTQATSKSTTVTNFTSVNGTITMNNAALAAGTVVSFNITGAANAATDLWATAHESGGTTGAYTINCRSTGAGAASCDVRNNTGGSLSEAIVIRAVIIKSVNA